MSLSSVLWALTRLILALILSRCSVISAGSGELFRCEREEDLDGTACRVDMLPDEALAEMIWERGFDPAGHQRMELIDAVMQLLEYEYATGENLREMDFNPYTETQEEEEMSAEASSQAEATAEYVAHEQGAAEAATSDFNSGESGLSAAASPDRTVDNHGGETGATEVEDLTGFGGVEAESVEEAVMGDAMVEAGGQDAGEGALERIQSADTVLGYAQELGMEVLKTMKRDLNAVVGLLPEPVAKPIREVASVACDTAVRIVVPAFAQAERYTRGLRREAAKSAGRLATRIKDEFGPRALRGVAAAFSKAKNSVSEAINNARGAGKREGGGEEDGTGGQGGKSGATPEGDPQYGYFQDMKDEI